MGQMRRRTRGSSLLQLRLPLAFFVAVSLVGCTNSGPAATVGASPTEDLTTPAPRPTPTEAASPTPIPPASGRIAYASIVESVQHFDVFTIKPDGTDEVKLVHGKHTFPRWSPDGSKVAMSSYWFGNFESTVNADGTSFVEYKNPDPSLTLVCTTWSADATRLACEGWNRLKRGFEGVYTVSSTTGQDLKRITTSVAGAHDIPGSYSPDGSQIAFVRTTYTVLHLGELWVCNADGSNAHKITDTLVDYRVAWSPDGKRIAADDNKDIVVFDLANLGGQPLRISIPNAFPTSPRWEPDGSRLVFLLSHKTGGSDIYTMDLDGLDLQRITTNGVNDGEPDWGRAP
jgi:Tol biopolymer transport system component